MSNKHNGEDVDRGYEENKNYTDIKLNEAFLDYISYEKPHHPRFQILPREQIGLGLFSSFLLKVYMCPSVQEMQT